MTNMDFGAGMLATLFLACVAAAALTLRARRRRLALIEQRLAWRPGK